MFSGHEAMHNYFEQYEQNTYGSLVSDDSFTVRKLSEPNIPKFIYMLSQNQWLLV